VTREVDARGRACPEPVLLTKKALEESGEITVIVDSRTAEENVKRFALSMKCRVRIERRGEDSLLFIEKPVSAEVSPEAPPYPASGPIVLVISSDRMGRGDDELGEVLMRSFIHTLGEASRRPETVIIFNTGVRLAVQGSAVLEDLRALCNEGVRILVCGTCLGFFEIRDKLAVGQISNMYDITETMLGAGKIVQI